MWKLTEAKGKLQVHHLSAVRENLKFWKTDIC